MSYTAKDIVTLVGNMSNMPGRLADIGRLLNVIQATYAKTIDEDIIRKTTTLSIGAQVDVPHPYPLPLDYLRVYDVFYLVAGEPFYLDPMELKDLDKTFTGPGVSNYPTHFSTDMATAPGGVTPAVPPNMYFYPPPAIPLTVTVRYRPQTGDITTPETSSTIPWFPDQRTLIKDLLSDVLMTMADEPQRGSALEAQVEKQMRKYLSISDDKEGFAQTVKLDPNTFRPRARFGPSKKTGF